MTTVVYEDEDGLKLVVEHSGKGNPPREIREGGRVYALSHMAYDHTQDDLGVGKTVAAPTRPSLRDGRFESRQLPRWDPIHKAGGGEFSPDGKPRFHSRQEAREYARRVSGETGVATSYGDL